MEILSQRLQNFILSRKVCDPTQREIIDVNDMRMELISKVIFSSKYRSFSRINLRIAMNWHRIKHYSGYIRSLN